MFGELGSSDIHDNEPNYGFDEFYNNGDGGYSSDSDRLTPSQDEDLWDVGSYDSSPSQAVPADNNVLQNDAQASGFESQNVEQRQYTTAQQAAGQAESAPASNKKSGGFIYILLLLLVFVAAGGMFFYKKYMSSDTGSTAEQSMGDYFYDKASADAGNASPSATNEPTATVDVNLSEPLPARPDEAAVPAKPSDEPNNGSADLAAGKAQEKELSPLEKAMLKKKADEQKESQLGISAKSVIVPVSSGGRVDPFMPYMQRDVLAKQTKFELIAPPTVIPEADPVVDELVQTKISGIMYDQARPSAIVNFGGEDQLVHKGDVVKGYNIVNITKNSVVIKYKNNIYQATVGQSLDDGVNLNPVSGLSNQFGGVYNKSAGNVIQFNE